MRNRLKVKYWRLLILCIVLFLLWPWFGSNNAEKVIKNTIGTDADLIILKEDHRVGGSRLLCLATDECSPTYYVVYLTENVWHRFECRNIRLHEWHPNVYCSTMGNFYSFVIDNPNIAYLGIVERGKERCIEVDEIPFVYFWDWDEEWIGRREYYLYTKAGDILK